MNKILLGIIGICIIASLLIPATVGLKCDSDKMDVSTTDSLIAIVTKKIDDDGHLIFNVSNHAIKDIDNATILVYLYGSGPFTNFNQVDVHTEIFIQNLPISESEFFKTKDQVFKVLPIFRRPVIPFFNGELELAINEHSGRIFFRKWFPFIQTDFIILPYP